MKYGKGDETLSIELDDGCMEGYIITPWFTAEPSGRHLLIASEPFDVNKPGEPPVPSALEENEIR